VAVTAAKKKKTKAMTAREIAFAENKCVECHKRKARVAQGLRTCKPCVTAAVIRRNKNVEKKRELALRELKVAERDRGRVERGGTRTAARAAKA
jgi:hypothetical protein